MRLKTKMWRYEIQSVGSHLTTEGPLLINIFFKGPPFDNN